MSTKAAIERGGLLTAIGRVCEMFHLAPSAYFAESPDARAFLRAYVSAKDEAEARASKKAGPHG